MLAYFYPRSPCGERPSLIVNEARSILISIHALLAESDQKDFRVLEGAQIFLSTLSLRRATRDDGNAALLHKFLSTLSLRRATRRQRGRPQTNPHFYPRSPCGERPPIKRVLLFHRGISIHALLAESDKVLIDNGKFRRLFLSTLSLRRATAEV